MFENFLKSQPGEGGPRRIAGSLVVAAWPFLAVPCSRPHHIQNLRLIIVLRRGREILAQELGAGDDAREAGIRGRPIQNTRLYVSGVEVRDKVVRDASDGYADGPPAQT